VTPTPLTAAALAVAALLALVLPWQVSALLMLAIATAAVVDALLVRRAPALVQDVPAVLYRGAPARLTVVPARERIGRLRVRQPAPADVDVEPAEASGGLDARVIARRRGRHLLPAPGVRSVGPLGLGAWHHRAGGERELLVYPDLPGAFRLAAAVRRGYLKDVGLRIRGPIGLGTEFESVREYVPDDDVRQLNWAASARTARPMTNQYRVEQDRAVVCLLDAGRLMAAPLRDRTRLDVALDAVCAVAAVADVVGDRVGVVAFDSEILREARPRHRGARDVIGTVFDLEASARDSDYARACQRVGDDKRAFCLVLTDLVEASAAQPLLEAVPLLRRRHSVAVASAADTDLLALASVEPERPVESYRAAVALDVLSERARVVPSLRRQGAAVVEAEAGALPAACVRAYLWAKAHAGV
jgi:uncharacterized protein (DUF58 family)